jgi:hypothetical protein
LPTKLDGNFPPEVKEKMLEACSGFCCCRTDCMESVTEFHHIMSNTQVNRKLYPLFIPSIFNCCPISHGCHMNHTVPRMSERLVQAYEWYLTEFYEKK